MFYIFFLGWLWSYNLLLIFFLYKSESQRSLVFAEELMFCDLLIFGMTLKVMACVIAELRTEFFDFNRGT